MSSVSLGWLWLVDWLSPTEGTTRALKRIVYFGNTEYQSILVGEVDVFGKVLVIDGKTQSTEGDEWIYHEALVHPVMLAHPEPKKVLVLGGGEGATLREVLKHKTVERAVMVDIDGEMIEVAKKYLSEWHKGSFYDPRAEVVIADGREYLEKTQEKFDVVIADLTDPLEGCPSMRLYTLEFYELVRKVLEDDGVFVTQSTSPLSEERVFAIIYNTVKKVFPLARLYTVFVPSFSVLWSFTVGSVAHDPAALSRDEVEEVIKSRIKGELKFYDYDAHLHMFSLPKHIKKVLEETSTISTDEEPVYLRA